MATTGSGDGFDPEQGASHYKGRHHAYEPIKVIRAWRLNFNLGCVTKYIGRLEDSDTPVEDLQKAIWYLTDEMNYRRGLQTYSTPVDPKERGGEQAASIRRGVLPNDVRVIRRANTGNDLEQS